MMNLSPFQRFLESSGDEEDLSKLLTWCSIGKEPVPDGWISQALSKIQFWNFALPSNTQRLARILNRCTEQDQMEGWSWFRSNLQEWNVRETRNMDDTIRNRMGVHAWFRNNDVVGFLADNDAWDVISEVVGMSDSQLQIFIREKVEDRWTWFFQFMDGHRPYHQKFIRNWALCMEKVATPMQGWMANCWIEEVRRRLSSPDTLDSLKPFFDLENFASDATVAMRINASEAFKAKEWGSHVLPILIWIDSHWVREPIQDDAFYKLWERQNLESPAPSVALTDWEMVQRFLLHDAQNGKRPTGNWVLRTLNTNEKIRNEWLNDPQERFFNFLNLMEHLHDDAEFKKAIPFFIHLAFLEQKNAKITMDFLRQQPPSRFSLREMVNRNSHSLIEGVVSALQSESLIALWSSMDALEIPERDTQRTRMLENAWKQQCRQPLFVDHGPLELDGLFTFDQ